MVPSNILSTLTRRVKDQEESALSNHPPQQNTMTTSSQLQINSSLVLPENLEPLPQTNQQTVPHAPSSPPTPPPPYVQPVISTSRSRTHPKKPNGESGPSLKRSRSSDRPIGSVKECENETVIDVELGRLLTSLSGEINEAMRIGDRSKVAVLMRQRDQLRFNRENVKSSNNNEPLIETETKTKRTRSTS